MVPFFISTPLGAEKICLSEMQRHWPHLLSKGAQPHTEVFPEVQIHEGGLEFQADLFVGLQLNFFLKTANRILLRLDTFRVRDLPKFYNRLQQISWPDYLQSSADVEWEIAAQKSRLNNEKRLQDSAQEALKNVLPTKPTTLLIKQKIFIRLFDDVCTVSVDTSGEHLHKRGWSPLKGEAPLRETLASYLLQEMIEGVPADSLAAIHLLDPMTGSGTFLTEGRSLNEGNFQRGYSFQSWPRSPKLFKLPLFSQNYKHPVRPVFASFQGLDLSEKMVALAQENWNTLQDSLRKRAKSSEAPAVCTLRVADAMKDALQMPQPLWMVLNPPYGERLSNEALETHEFLERLCLNYGPQKIGVLLPENQRLKAVPAGYQVQKQVKLGNGGIRCLFSVLTRV